MAVLWVSLLVSLSLFISSSNAISSYSPLHRESIPTDICDVTSLAELVEMQKKVNYERIACEGETLNSYECSRYWMAYNDFVRNKLAYDLCTEQEKTKFQTWAGTSTVEGVFQIDYHDTLGLIITNNKTLNELLSANHGDLIKLLVDGTQTTRNQLHVTEQISASNERINSFNEASSQRDLVSLLGRQARTFVEDSGNKERTFVEEVETQTRDLLKEDGSHSRETVHSEHKSTRDLLSLQLLNTRQLYSSEENQTRTTDIAEEGQTRDTVKETETDQRAHISSEEDNNRNLERENQNAIRNLDTLQEETTRNKDLSEEDSTREATRHEEQSSRNHTQEQEENTRSHVSQEFQSTRSEDEKEESNSKIHVSENQSRTRALTRQEEQTSRGLVQSKRDILQAEVSQSSSSEGVHTNSDAQIEGTAKIAEVNLTRIETNTKVKQASAGVKATWDGAANAVLANIFGYQGGEPTPLFDSISMHFNLVQTAKSGNPAVELYSRPEKFTALRALVNSTLAYNLDKYGRSINSIAAGGFWNDGENARMNNKYRPAVASYSAAYYWAIKPYQI